jgi:hypothetical protein
VSVTTAPATAPDHCLFAGALHGRDHELTVADAAIAACTTAGLVVVWIEGEAGIGKTRLLDEVVGRASSRGFTARRGAATPFERTRAFAPLLEALDCRRSSEDPRRAEVADRAAAVRAEFDPLRVTTEPIGAHEVREAVLALLDEASADGPLVVALDDVAWADAATFTTLGVAARRLAHRPIALVLTARPEDHRPEIDAFHGRVEPVLTTIALHPLPPAEMRALLAEAFGGVPSPTTVADFERAGGNPFLCLALARSALEDGVVSCDSDGRVRVAARSLPANLRETVLRRMAALPSSTTDVLRYAAVLGPVFAADDLAQALGTAAAQLAAPLQRAVRAGLLHSDGVRLGFRHALVREAIYDDLPVTLRGSLHRELATSLHAAGGHPSLVAHHAMLGASPGDQDAATFMVDGAACVVAHDTAFAVTLLERAAGVAVPLSRPWSRAVCDLVVALQWQGLVDTAEEWCRTGLALPVDPRTRVDLKVRLAWCRGMRGDLRGALGDIQDAALAADLPDDVRATLHSEAATLAAWTFQEAALPVAAEAEAAVVLGDRSGDVAAAVQGRCVQSFLALMRGRGERGGRPGA